MDIDRPVHKDKASLPYKKLNKIQKQWSKLTGEDVFKSDIFKCNVIEKMFKFIQNNENLLVNKSDCEKIMSLINNSMIKITLGYSTFFFIKPTITSEFSRHFEKYFEFKEMISNTIITYPNKRFKKMSLIKENIIRSILNENKTTHVSLKRIRLRYEEKTGNCNFSIYTLRKFMRSKMNLRYKKVVTINAKRNENRHLLMKHLFLKKFIDHHLNCKTFIYIDESSFQGYNSHMKTWIDSNSNGKYFSNGRFKSVSLIAAMSEMEMVHCEVHEKTIKGKDFLSYFKALHNIMETKNKSLDIFKKKDYVYYMDNATTHYNKDVTEYFKENKINVLFGVPYCPEYNPIELFFAEIKKKFYSAFTISM